MRLASVAFALAVCWWQVVALAQADRPPGRRFALIVSGVSGGEKYAASYDRWRNEIARLLVERYGFAPDATRVLAETEAAGLGRATAVGVRSALAEIGKVSRRGDLVLIVLVGHGSLDGAAAKFNLVGPDLDASEWARLLDSLDAKVVLINTASASAPFLRTLASPDRVVITATDRPSQTFETVFPEHFVRALAAEATDMNRDGLTSLWEIFVATAERVRAWYEERRRMPTERALIDDVGDGTGKEAGVPNSGGESERIYLGPLPAAAAAGQPAGVSAARRAELLAQIAELRAHKDEMPLHVYEATLQVLLVELARVKRSEKEK
ncbi:MAG: hypothetical protein ACE148_00400 [Vicinamibacterales bacterium]